MKFTLDTGLMEYNLNSIKVGDNFYPIVNLEDPEHTKYNYNRLVTEFNMNTPAEFLSLLPFDNKYHFSDFTSDGTLTPTGAYFIKDTTEYLKIFVPKNTAKFQLGNLNDELEFESTITCTTDYDELQYEMVLEFDSTLPDSEKSSELDLHISQDILHDPNPHLDTQLGCNFQYNKLQPHSDQIHSMNQFVGVIGNTYVDKSGRLYYLGDYHE